MKLLFALLLFTTALNAQSFHGQASIIRDSVTLKVKPYVDIEYNTICVSFNNVELSYRGVWKQRSKTEYRLMINDDEYWQLDIEKKELSLRDMGDNTTYVLQ